ncbi:MAG: peptidoglycan DD-metalloendopeptidase family protein [Desulfobacterales bacterium]
MRKKITFFVLGSTRSSIKQVTVSKVFLRILSLFLVSCLIFIGFIIYDYNNFQQTKVDSNNLQKKVSYQQEEIADQRKQIQKFASEINMLKSKLLVLNDFEKKIRIVANTEKTNEEKSLFGIGGSKPEDLDTKVQLTKKHNSLVREMHEQVKQLSLASTNQKEGFESLLKYLEDQRNLLACTPTIRPTRGWISSRFGYRISPFTGRREFHKGLDIANRKGTPIIVPADGVVAFNGKKGLLGKMITIDHGHGMVTRYGHIKKAMKKQGEAVKRGDTIALMGNTGRSTGPHLHYEVRLNGVQVNPTKYILN